MLDRLYSWLKGQLAIDRASRELSSMTDRELKDMGINRGDIPRILNRSFAYQSFAYQ